MSEFVWTEERVRELLNYHTFTKPGHKDWTEEIEDFKATKQPKPEWEILAINFHKPHSWLWDSSANSYFLPGHTMRFTRQEIYEGDNGQGNVSIHSVKRLLDGEVFTVGDIVTVGGRSKPIKGFKVQMGAQKALVFFHDGSDTYLDYLKHARQTPIPVLLTPAQIEKLHKLISL